MASSMRIQTIARYLKNNLIIISILIIIGFVGIVAFLKLFNAPQKNVYVKVKVAQGLWWANTTRPSIWFAKSFQKGDEERGLTGKAEAQIVDVAYYPWTYQDGANSQYDVYLTIKLIADYNSTRDSYTYKRSRLAIGAPIDFDFANVQTSGTIIDISSIPFKDQYEDKLITIYKPHIKQDSYDQIKVGDSYFNGSQKALEIVAKEAVPTQLNFVGDDGYIQSPIGLLDVTVTLRMKVKKINGAYIYQEEVGITPGKNLEFATDNYFFDQFSILRIE